MGEVWSASSQRLAVSESLSDEKVLIIVWEQLDLKTGSHRVKPFWDRTGPPQWLWLWLTLEVTKGRLAAASSHVVSRLEPKQEINDCLVFLVFSRSYDAQRLDVLNQVHVQSSCIIIYCWPIILSFTRYDTAIPFMFTCTPTALITLPQSQLPSFNHNGSSERPSPSRSSLLTLLTMQRQRSRTGKGESMRYRCRWAVDWRLGVASWPTPASLGSSFKALAGKMISLKIESSSHLKLPSPMLSATSLIEFIRHSRWHSSQQT